MRKKGSPGHTATAGYMAEQSQRNSPNVPFDIDFGDEPQPAVAPRGLTSSQLQVSQYLSFGGPENPILKAPRPYRPGYSESEATSDDSCYRPRPPTSFRLSPSPHPPEVEFSTHSEMLNCLLSKVHGGNTPSVPYASSTIFNWALCDYAVCKFLSGFQRRLVPVSTQFAPLAPLLSDLGQL